VRTGDDEPDYLVGIIEDIAKRRTSEALLQRYRRAWHEAPDVLLAVRRADGRIVDASRAAEVAYGFGRERLLELTLADLTAGDGTHVPERLECAVREGQPFASAHRCADGSVFPVDVSVLGVPGEGGDEALLRVARGGDEGDAREAEERSAGDTA
jgi:PAS domain S-box-containing protein